MDTNANNRRGRESIRPNAHVQQTAAGNIEFSVNYTNESMRCDRLWSEFATPQRYGCIEFHTQAR